jgi:small-conductance mechanosensitive channel
MKLSDVTELVEYFMNFKLFEVNKTAITPSSIFMFLIVIAVFALASRLIQQVLRAHIFSRLRIDEGIQYTLTRISHYLIMIIGAVVAFQFIGIDLTGLAIILGFLSVGIGFGLQNITSNFVAGLILLLERPIKVGDRVTVGDQEGDVVEIKMRSTTIRTLNNVAVIVPNSEFVSSRLENWSYGDQKVRLNIDVGVSYMGFGDSAWNMRLRIWLERPRRHPQVRSDINCAIVRKFHRNGVEIPFPQRDLHVRSPLPLPVTPGTELLRSA